MHNHSTTDPFAPARATSLTPEERAAGRAQLRAFMALHPRRQRAPFFAFARATSLALSLVALVGGGTAFAANGALPGDTLYPVKLSVVEPLQGALAVTDQQKADREVDLASRRLEELAEAASSGDAAPEDFADARASLTEHLGAAHDRIDALNDAGSPGDALQANTDLAAALDAHQQILESVSDAHPEVAQQLDAVVDQLEDSLADAAEASPDLEASVADAPARDEFADTISDQRASFDEGLESLRNALAEAPLAADDRATVEMGIASAVEDRDAAEAARTAGREEEAVGLYADAGQQLAMLEALVDARVDLAVDAINASSTEQ